MPINVGSNGGALKYDKANIKASLGLRSKQPDAWAEFLASDPDSLEEQEAARNLTKIFTGISASQLMGTTKNDDKTNKIEEWFTQQSIVLYGTQDPDDTKKVMTNDLAILNQPGASKYILKKDLDKLLAIYENLGIETRNNKTKKLQFDERMSVSDIEFRNIILSEFGFVLDYFDFNKMYTSDELKDVTKQILKYLQSIDKRWNDWRATVKKDGSMSVSTYDKELKIGMKRASSIGIEAAASLIHELAAHIKRSINGESSGDKDLQHGLAEYIEFEEGFGCYIEYLVTGYIPNKISNRQIAASLALGQLGDGRKYDRNEIYEVLALRTKLLMQSKGKVEPEVIKAKEKEVRTLVIDRFFRGGRGVEPVMPVYTRDVMYARGFEEVRKYIKNQSKRGVSLGELYEFLMSAKFDPTRIDHLYKLEACKLKVIAQE